MSGDNLKNTLAVFVADMARPWTIMDSLQKWASVLREHVDKLKIPPEEMRIMEQRCEYGIRVINVEGVMLYTVSAPSLECIEYSG